MVPGDAITWLEVVTTNGHLTFGLQDHGLSSRGETVLLGKDASQTLGWLAGVSRGELGWHERLTSSIAYEVLLNLHQILYLLGSSMSQATMPETKLLLGLRKAPVGFIKDLVG